MRSTVHIAAFLFFLTTPYLYGQTFGSKNAEWVYDHNGMVSGVTSVKAVGDTLVDNRKVTIFEKHAFRIDGDGALFDFQFFPVYIREENGIVEFSEKLVDFDTLYNFNLDIGDSWTIKKRHPFTGEFEGDSIVRTVVDTFTLKINDINVFCQGVRYFNNNFVDTIYQDIGTALSYILPFDFMAVAADGGEGGVLRCFKNDELGVLDYEESFTALCPTCIFSIYEYDCDQLSSITTSLSSNTDFQVYPNPASNYLSIRSAEEGIESLSIYNVSGRSILNKEYNDPSIEIDISDFPSGMYFMLINERYYEKLVVSHE